MEETKTLEHLAISLIEQQHLELYQSKILPLYDKVRGIVHDYKPIDENLIQIESSFKDNLGLNEEDMLHLMLHVGHEFGIVSELWNTHYLRICDVRGLVDHIACKLAPNYRIDGDYDCKVAELINTSLGEVNDTYKKVISKIRWCFKYWGIGLDLDTPLSDSKGSKLPKLLDAIDIFTGRNVLETQKLIREGTIYDVVKHVAMRDVKLAIPIYQ